MSEEEKKALYRRIRTLEVRLERSEKTRHDGSNAMESSALTLALLDALEAETGRLRRTLGRMEQELAETHARLSRYDLASSGPRSVGDTMVCPTHPTLQ